MKKDYMEAMRVNFDYQDMPKLGIFWLDVDNKRLFGVSKIEAMDVPFVKGLETKTIRALHKDWWCKQQFRLEAGKEVDEVYRRDYTSIPRGRIFQTVEGVFQLMVGSWINEYDYALELIKDEFSLEEVDLEVIIDEHWELGHGWSE